MIAVILPLIAASLPADPTARQLIEFAVGGLAVVLLSLSALAIFCSGVGYLFQIGSAKTAPSRKPVSDDGTLSDEIVAVIAAAVATVVSTPHRIVHIRGLTTEELGWSLGGRLQHHASHQDSHRPHH
jgi:glutaconyl-CoA/methylmalonyl-CoA decarboxylase subunit delta